MRVRLAICGICGVLLFYCGAALFATPAVPAVCCTGDIPGECRDFGGVCCDTESLGMLPCAVDMTGVCMSLCVKPGGDGG